MEDIIQLIVNNGLGIASFGALLYFVDKYLSKMNTLVEHISNTLVEVEKSLSDLNVRVEKLEKIKKEN